ncbi:hypothetical protein A9W95_23080 [Mycobacterium sp. 1423905.2]|nr:hypothetical protein A9W95_23080 [Mycobacterium sp. 1423905.2]
MLLRAATRALALLAVTVVAGCGTWPFDNRARAPRPDTPVTIPQPELEPGFVLDADPMRVLRDGVYFLRSQVKLDALMQGNFVVITGYRRQVAADGSSVQTGAYQLSPRNEWQAIADDEVVWSPSQQRWLTPAAPQPCRWDRSAVGVGRPRKSWPTPQLATSPTATKNSAGAR